LQDADGEKGTAKRAAVLCGISLTLSVFLPAQKILRFAQSANKKSSAREQS
jgi:hypothetical protein